MSAPEPDIPDTYLVAEGQVYALSPDGTELWTAPVNEDRSIDWDNLGEIYDADGSWPHIEALMHMLGDLSRVNVQLRELY